MHIEHILEQGSGARNEDCLIMDGNIFGVFDGATSLDGACFGDGESGGSLASSIAGQAFLRNHHPLLRLGVEANDAIRAGMESRRVDMSSRRGLWSASAAVVRLRDGAVEWFQTGDCQVVFIDGDGGFRLPAVREDHDYSTLCMIRERGRFHPEVQALIETVREGMNRDYGVLNGEREAIGFFRAGTEPVGNVKSVLLFTDGLDVPCSSPARKKDYSCLVGMACELGLRGLRDHVRGREAADPDIEYYPRFKMHDDIAAVAIHF
ncbi:protein phosphatase 2C domain-containing protein [Desulfomicrobium escambiense]|uniref:protein phosphatase 2C domain-containing protein n=1 Tax=Desulfomicrobium escambiense TaxID=29503 RepID=UPI00041B3496|nr:protein phosphatase 2C domain-containing protein [Desulfomicrobium escambiense]